MAKAILIPGKEKRVQSGHPWIYRSDIARVEGAFTPGDVVDVCSSKGRFLAKAYYNPASQISLRILSCGKSSPARGMRRKKSTPHSSVAAFMKRWPIGVPSRICPAVALSLRRAIAFPPSSLIPLGMCW